jgi:hypothetical protein
MKSSWLKMDKEIDEQKCQSIYWNLIVALEVRDGLGALLVNELKHTVSCDHVHNLSHVRESVEKEMTSESLTRVLNANEDARDEIKAERAIYHYHSWAKDEVYKGLSTSKKLYYHTLFHWEKWVAGFTVGGGLYKLAKDISSRN